MSRKNIPDSKPRDLIHRRRCDRTGKFWTEGAANPIENARNMRRDYLRQTARLLYVHGWNCFAPFNLEIGREP
jgi:hypothetical protein